MRADVGIVPMGRFATPDVLARAVACHAGFEQSGFVNGHTLSVDGGWASLGRRRQDY